MFVWLLLCNCKELRGITASDRVFLCAAKCQVRTLYSEPHFGTIPIPRRLKGSIVRSPTDLGSRRPCRVGALPGPLRGLTWGGRAEPRAAPRERHGGAKAPPGAASSRGRARGSCLLLPRAASTRSSEVDVPGSGLRSSSLSRAISARGRGRRSRAPRPGATGPGRRPAPTGKPAGRSRMSAGSIQWPRRPARPGSGRSRTKAKKAGRVVYGWSIGPPPFGRGSGVSRRASVIPEISWRGSPPLRGWEESRGLSHCRCQDRWTARTLWAAMSAQEVEASLCQRRISAPPTASTSSAETVRARPPSLRKSRIAGPWRTEDRDRTTGLRYPLAREHPRRGHSRPVAMSGRIRSGLSKSRGP